ncbi:Hypothetical Protein FCC1311_081512 [Hondaea fermentalgiana]|uniref:Uncharacterized protein n=1 Tax=Hondaea fermentalgiana TaxID=2315210 RepID=A0A2R5GM05_9STRA|nr:Hypothetical Protein FCC1311_081512 [Hondaea fermentalgiana]|eukprot:GBG31926.1 Hypothetical Protein FCC1311_081512 [Hondaea fermentalgiana]
MLRAAVRQSRVVGSSWRGLSTMAESNKRTRYEMSEHTLIGAGMEAKTLIEGKTVKLDDLKGKAVLVSNVATT